MSYRYIDSKKLLNGVTFYDQNGAQHTTKVLDTWTPEQRTAANIEPVPPSDPKPDRRFYEPSGKEKRLEDKLEFEEDGVTPIIDPETGQQLVTEGVKTVLKRTLNNQFEGHMRPTDDYFTRERETGKPIPQQVKAYRQALRKRLVEIETAIDACASTDELKALYEGTETTPPFATTWPSKHDTFTDYVPYNVTRRQARKALKNAGLLDAVEAAITDPDDRLDWDQAITVERNNPLIAAMATSLGLTDEQIDDLFRLAETL